MQFITRAYNSLKINESNLSTVIKESSDSKLLDEINYYKNLPENLKIFFPRYVTSGTSTSKPYKLELEHFAYDNLGNKMIKDKFIKEDWEKVFDFIFNYIDIYKKEKKIKSTSTDFNRMLIDKTKNEYFKLNSNNDFFNKFCKYDSIVLNNKPLLNFSVLWKELEIKLKDIKIPEYFYYFHGDLCFSNILYSMNPINSVVNLKFVDPRGKYGFKKFFGDLYYDLAKLSHSTNGGYEYLIYDQFELDISKNNVDLKYKNQNKKRIDKIFENKINESNYNLDIIRLIEGLIFVGMCARHYDNEKRQKAMYVIGLKLLNEYYEKI